MDNKEYDYLIVGAGCAGLSLAYHLAQRVELDNSILILDSKPSFEDDRTWCFFDTEEHLFSDLVKHRWQNCRLIDNNGFTDIHCGHSKYSMIKSGDFYERVVTVLNSDERFELVLGEPIETIRSRVGYVEVTTDRRIVKAKLVFDSRPLAWARLLHSGTRPFLLQQFVGWTIETAADEYSFDPETAILMDFSTRDDQSISFIYTLPLSPTKALVEATLLSRKPTSRLRLTRQLERYLENKEIRSFEILSREGGVIPMSAAFSRDRFEGRILNIGLRGGLARPSSGYSFLNIQRDSKLISDSIVDGAKGGDKLKQYQYPQMDIVMDEVILGVLEKNPHLFSELMIKLFQRCDTESLIRFLSGKAEIMDYAKVANAMPFKDILLKASGGLDIGFKRYLRTK